jgi:hypothetical protein
MSLLTAVEYTTSNPARRIALYGRRSAEDDSIGAAKDLTLLERRAKAKGFQVSFKRSDGTVTSAWERYRTDLTTVRSPHRS